MACVVNLQTITVTLSPLPGEKHPISLRKAPLYLHQIPSWGLLSHITHREVNAGEHSAQQQSSGAPSCPNNAPFGFSSSILKARVYHIPKKIQSQIFSGNRKYLAPVMKAPAVYQVFGKVCHSSFVSLCSMTVRDRAPTWECWGLSNLTKTYFSLLQTHGEGFVSVLETCSKGNIHQPCYNYAPLQSSSRRST